jgi:hypothetical protein
VLKGLADGERKAVGEEVPTAFKLNAAILGQLVNAAH